MGTKYFVADVIGGGVGFALVANNLMNEGSESYYHQERPLEV
jgi:hypothetical protein